MLFTLLFPCLFLITKITLFFPSWELFILALCHAKKHTTPQHTTPPPFPPPSANQHTHTHTQKEKKKDNKKRKSDCLTYVSMLLQVELFCVNHLINCSLESTEEFICMEFRFTLRDNGMRAAFQLLHMVLEVI